MTLLVLYLVLGMAQHVGAMAVMALAWLAFGAPPLMVRP